MNNKRGPQGLILLAKRSIAPVVWMPLLSVAMLCILLIDSSRSVNAGRSEITAQSTHNKPLNVSATKPVQAQPAAESAAQTSPTASASPVQSVAAVVSTAPYCNVATFGAPSAILAESSAVGVTIVTDPPVYYSFRGGATNSKTIALATDCARQQPALRGKFHGVTERSIKYAYTINPINDTTCRVDAVRVTLHQGVLLPYADMAGLPTTAVNQWQASSEKLRAHEYEHVGINSMHVQRIYDQLNGYIGPCANLDSEASGVAEKNIADMNTANQSLDATTNHGTS